MAQSDLTELVTYINQFYAETALSYYDEVINAIGTLAQPLERCPWVSDETLRLKGYRWLGVKNYVIFYVIKERTVQIRRIMFNKRQYKDLL